MNYFLIVFGIIAISVGTAMTLLGARFDYLINSTVSAEQQCKNADWLLRNKK